MPATVRDFVLPGPDLGSAGSTDLECRDTRDVTQQLCEEVIPALRKGGDAVALAASLSSLAALYLQQQRLDAPRRWCSL